MTVIHLTERAPLSTDKCYKCDSYRTWIECLGCLRPMCDDHWDDYCQPCQRQN